MSLIPLTLTDTNFKTVIERVKIPIQRLYYTLVGTFSTAPNNYHQKRSP